jgi:uncharacterized protein YfiM (DUF2279 family)
MLLKKSLSLYSKYSLPLVTFILLTIFIASSSLAQDTVRNRKILPKAINLSLTSLAYYEFTSQMTQHFFRDYPYGNFHLKHDWKTWRGLDKFYHNYGSYQMSAVFYQANRISGLDSIEALNLAFLESTIFSTTKEFADGHIDIGGWSWNDILMNFTGNSLFYTQQRWWGRQRIQYKFNYFSSGIQQFSPKVLGTSYKNYWLKDYNGETFWLSSSLGDWNLTENKWLKPLGICIGYGANNLIGEWDNPNTFTLPRYSQYYLGLDINWQQIPTQNKLLKTMFFLLNRFRFPLPSIEFNSLGKLQFHSFKS